MAMDKARRQNRELAALLAVGVFGLAVELIGATRGAHGPVPATSAIRAARGDVGWCDRGNAGVESGAAA